MSRRIEDIMTLVLNVSEEENFRVTERWAVSSGVAACAGAVVGFLLGGPWGGVRGASLGAAIIAGTAKDFKPLRQSIAEWPEQKIRQLAENIEPIIQRADARDVAALGVMAAGAAPALRAEIASAVVDYCQNEMSLQFAGR